MNLADLFLLIDKLMSNLPPNKLLLLQSTRSMPSVKVNNTSRSIQSLTLIPTSTHFGHYRKMPRHGHPKMDRAIGELLATITIIAVAAISVQTFVDAHLATMLTVVV